MQETNNTEIYSQIEMLDREWSNKMPDYMVNGTLPTTDGNLTSFMAWMGILVVAFLSCFGFVAKLSAPIFIGLFVIFMSRWSLKTHKTRIRDYTAAKKTYEEKRELLIQQLK